MAIIPRQTLVKLVEEINVGKLPTDLDGSGFFATPIADGQVNENPTYVQTFRGGKRTQSHRITTAKTYDFSIPLEMLPKDGGWTWKWSLGQMIARPSLGFYQFTPAAIGTELKTFAVMVDNRKTDFYGLGEQTGLMLGCVVTSAEIAGTGDPGNERMLVTLNGIARQPLVATSGVIDVLDYADVAAANNTITIVVNGTTVTLTEGTDFTAATDNTTTAANIVTAFNTAVTGVHATSSAGTVTTTAQAGFVIYELRTNAEPSNMTAVRLTSDVLRGMGPLRFAESTLLNSAYQSPYHFKNSIANIDSAGYTANNNWKAFALTITNQVFPQTFSSETHDPFIDRYILGAQTYQLAVTKNLEDAAQQLHDWRNSTDRDIAIRLTHPVARLSSGTRYQTILHFFDVRPTDANPLFGFGTSEESEVRVFANDAFVPEVPGLDISQNLTGTNHTLDVDTTFTAGSAGDAEAKKITTNSGGYLTRIRLLMLTDSAGTTEKLLMRIYSDDGGSPSKPSALVTGAISTHIQGEMFSEVQRAVYFTFPTPPKLEPNTVYWVVLYSQGAGSGTVRIVGNLSGSSIHFGTHDGGQNWDQPGASGDDANWNIQVECDDLPLVIEHYVEVSGSELYPNAA